MIAGILAFLNIIPGVATAVQAIVGKVYDSKVAMYAARWGVTKDVAVAAIQAEAAMASAKVGWLQAVASSPFLMFIVGGFATPWIILEWKVIVYDNVWQHWGTFFTDPVRGAIGDWGSTIITGIFITTGGLGIAHAVLNKKD